MEAKNEQSRKRPREDDGPAKIVKLQVGDHRELVARETLTRFGESTLARMFGEDWAGSRFFRTEDGYVFLDRDAEIFRGVLRFLRTGIVHFDPRNRRFNEALREELDFWNLPWRVGEKEKGFDCAARAETDDSGGGSTTGGPFTIEGVTIEVKGFTDDPQLAKTIMWAAASVAQSDVWPKKQLSETDYANERGQLGDISRAVMTLLPDTHAWIVTAGNERGTPLSWSTDALAPIHFTVKPKGRGTVTFCVISIEK